MLVEARRWAERVESPDVVNELVGVADAFVADPSVFGFEDRVLAESMPSTEIRSPSEPSGLAPIHVRLLTADDSDHAWLLFESGGHTIIRMVPRPELELSEETSE